MAKNSSSHNHNLLHVVIILLVFICLFAFAKHFIRQAKWNSYVVDSQKSVTNYKSLDSAEDAGLIAATIINIPSGSPLIKQPQALQNYIQLIGEKMGRDILVIDTSKKILADVISINVGKKYESDKNGEVLKTIGDGLPREFVEESIDYQNGIDETVIALKNLNGATVGAVIISTSTIFSK